MCRLLGYLGTSLQLDRLIEKPEHSLMIQSYQPREMTSGLLNADGFGMGWYHPEHITDPFTYKTTLPAWNDINLPNLTRYIQSDCVLANVRSATAGQAVDLSNCQPFRRHLILGIHNGFIADFRQTLYRPIRERLSDELYQSISGSTDSEHIFALVMQFLEATPNCSLTEALCKTLETLSDLGEKYEVDFSANIILSDGKQLVASRFANRSPIPTLYWIRDDVLFPNSVLIASEPLFSSSWVPFGDRSVLTVDHDLNIQTIQL